jgi:hypothetical protein
MAGFSAANPWPHRIQLRKGYLFTVSVTVHFYTFPTINLRHTVTTRDGVAMFGLHGAH